MILPQGANPTLAATPRADEPATRHCWNSRRAAAAPSAGGLLVLAPTRAFHLASLAEYEVYRGRFGVDPEFVAADRIRDESGCVVRYERTFLRPLLS